MKLIDLQYNMRQHSLRYQSAIANLKTSEKIQHYALVVGGIASDFYQTPPGDNPDTQHGIVLLYPVIQLANYLNINLADHYQGEWNSELGLCVRNWTKSSLRNGGENQTELMIGLIDIMGEYCKIAEAIDHMEPIDFRTETHKVVGHLFRLAVRIAAFEGYTPENLESKFTSYVRNIERKNPLRETFGLFPQPGSIDGYQPL